MDAGLSTSVGAGVSAAQVCGGPESREVTFTSLPGITTGPLTGSWIAERGDGGWTSGDD